MERNPYGSHISAKRHSSVVRIGGHEKNKPNYGLETFNLNRQLENTTWRRAGSFEYVAPLIVVCVTVQRIEYVHIRSTVKQLNTENQHGKFEKTKSRFQSVGGRKR